MAVLATLMHIHPLTRTSNFYSREMYAKRLSFFCLSRFKGATYAHVDISKCRRSTEPLVPSMSSHPFLKFFAIETEAASD